MTRENGLQHKRMRHTVLPALLALASALAAGCTAAPLPPHSAPAFAESAPTGEATPAPLVLPTVTPQSPYAVQGAAPELTNDVWLNSEPLRLAGLRGKVVLIDFWTYG